MDPTNWTGSGGILQLLGEHLLYCLIAVGVAAAIGIPIGLYVGRTGRGRGGVVGIANSFRAIPTLGLLVLLVIVLAPILRSQAAFFLPSMIVLVILAVPPLLTSTFAGVEAVPAATIDAADGMGMRPAAVLFQVQLPCALPLIIAGFRLAFLQVISTATVAAYVSLGGLGRLIIDGQAQRNTDKMIAGAVLVALLVILVDVVLAVVSRLIVSPGLSRLPVRPFARPRGRNPHPITRTAITTGETT
jgi:osmoprotectant transport system permease protein